jgi:hypothetical protein
MPARFGDSEAAVYKAIDAVVESGLLTDSTKVTTLDAIIGYCEDAIAEIEGDDDLDDVDDDDLDDGDEPEE